MEYLSFHGGLCSGSIDLSWASQHRGVKRRLTIRPRSATVGFSLLLLLTGSGLHELCGGQVISDKQIGSFAVNFAS
jgi:hypothetical protein